MSERKEHIHPDEFNTLVTQVGEFVVNAKFDRIDHFAHFGAYILKVYDDEDGLVSLHLSEDEALKVFEQTDLPICNRTFMYESEYRGYLRAQAHMLNDEMYGGFDEEETDDQGRATESE